MVQQLLAAKPQGLHGDYERTPSNDACMRRSRCRRPSNSAPAPWPLLRSPTERVTSPRVVDDPPTPPGSTAPHPPENQSHHRRNGCQDGKDQGHDERAGDVHVQHACATQGSMEPFHGKVLGRSSGWR